MGTEKYFQNIPKGLEVATLAGGCFWGVEELFQKQEGVIDTQTGYSGGEVENPNYFAVTTGKTGHAEAIQVVFDPKKTSYEKLVKYFFKIHDPTTLNQQGNDKGTQYRSAIFYHNKDQKVIAERVLKEVSASNSWKRPIVTQIVEFKKFYRAEEYHQDYLKRNPNGYSCHYERDVSF